MWRLFQWTVAVMVVLFHPAVGAPCFFLKGGFLASDEFFLIILFFGSSSSPPFVIATSRCC